MKTWPALIRASATKLAGKIRGVKRLLIKPDENESQVMVSLINETLRDWRASQNNFNFFSDADMIDYSVFSINAAEKRYQYLIRKARELHLGVIPAQEQGAGKPPGRFEESGQ